MFIVALVLNCKGPEGPQGPEGLAGKDGVEGEKGDKGDKGDKGEKGNDATAYVYSYGKSFYLSPDYTTPTFPFEFEVPQSAPISTAQIEKGVVLLYFLRNSNWHSIPTTMLHEGNPYTYAFEYRVRERKIEVMTSRFQVSGTPKPVVFHFQDARIVIVPSSASSRIDTAVFQDYEKLMKLLNKQP